jgi:hypothetical protein
LVDAPVGLAQGTAEQSCRSTSSTQCNPSRLTLYTLQNISTLLAFVHDEVQHQDNHDLLFR